ncbi:Fanconi anemia group J protein homolog [Ylistrum balloti]|uniref:Fanconi anemia group J protein homolog n=1 Tax=Ylistrum balloti TaxID=509963 RepID=UPI002905F64F|nr:Fanconi anemia group J protein homolog [Ylistrum balloti]
MAAEEKRMIHGMQVVFPCKPYPSQFSMMEKVIKGIERKQNCLLESPTGSGKSLALLCSALAWQTAEYEKKRKSEEAEAALMSNESKNCTCQKSKEVTPPNIGTDDVHSTQDVVQVAAELISVGDSDDDDFKGSSTKFKTPGNSDKTKARRSHQSIAYETSPPMGEEPSCGDNNVCCACSCKQEPVTAVRKVPKIYFGSRTHKQITQIVRELRKTAYKEARMTILGSREHTCIHPSVSKMKGKNEGCKELLDGPGCKFNDRVKKVFACQSQIKDLGLTEAWDLEDIIGVGQAKTACPYYGTRSLKKDADIIFCPYNYLIDPIIREAMEINVKDQIIILDEAHNMEDAAREAASQTIKCDELERVVKELDEMISYNLKTPEHLRIRQACSGLIKFMEDNEASLEQQSYDQAYRCWYGYDIVVRMEQLGIGPKHYPEIKMTTSLCLCFLMSCNFVAKKRHHRVAIVKTTSYVSNRDTDNSWLSAKKKRGGMRATPVTVNSLNFWCMNPGVAFSDFKDTRNIVLTSGTLSPMSSFESELGVPFPIKLEANHVIEDKQVWVGAISHGPKGGSLQAVYKTMETFNFQDELGELVLKVCQKVPHGVLIFLPSYKALQKFSERWKNTGLWAKIERKKKILSEPRASDKVDFESLMKNFYDTIDCCHDEDEGDIDGALFMAVCRGKVSEGLDFADNNARAVITVGIPFPNIKDVQVKLKKEYNDMHKNTRGLLSGGEWYEIQAFRALNQALGRCIRHRKDWGALILADERFVRDSPRYCKGLSKWMRNKVRPYQGFYTAMDSLTTFTETCIKDMPKVDPNMSFIPGTPVTPGHPSDVSQIIMSPVTSTPISKPIVKPKKNFSIFTPIKSGKGAAHQSNQSLQSTNQEQYKLLSPTEVKGDATLRKASESQQVIKAPGKGQSSTTVAPTVAMQGSVLGPAYEQILKLLNSKLLPQDKPYYVMMNEGTPTQQMFLIQPPDNPDNKQDLSDQNVGTIMSTPVTPHRSGDTKKQASTLPIQTGMKNILPKRLSEVQGKSQVSESAKLSNVNSNSGSSTVVTSNHNSSSFNQSGDKVSDKSESEISGNNEDSKTKKFFQFCKLPGKSFESVKKSEQCSNISSDRPTTPDMFDADTLEDTKNNSVQADEDKSINKSVKDTVKLDKTQDNDVKMKSVVRKPIFRKTKDIESEAKQWKIEEDSSDNDFQVKRRSVSGNSDLDCQVNRCKEEEEEEEKPLKIRRRGTKRKNHNRPNTIYSKRSKGVNFLDSTDSSKENKPSDHTSLSCAKCGTDLIPNLQDYEKRWQTPSFLKNVSHQKNVEYIYTMVTKPDQFSPVEVNVAGVTVNSTWSGETGCCVQFLRCQGCCRRTNRSENVEIIGARVVCISQDNKLYSVGQTWLLSAEIKIKAG